MRNTKDVLPFVIVFSLFVILASPYISYAQKASATPADNQIPSDLSLDLKLAQDNPDPDQKTFQTSEVKQVQLVTQKGQVDNLKPQDLISDQVKTESTKDVEHPEQTTSEQVVSQTVTIDSPKPTNQDQPAASSGNVDNGVGSPQPSDNTLVPGTTVTAPDDNAAPVESPTPADNSSVNVQGSPTDTTGSSNASPADQQTPTPTQANIPSNDSSGSTPAPNNSPADTSTPVPAQPETQSTQSNAPADTNNAPTVTQPAPADNSQPASGDNQQSNSAGSSNSGSSGGSSSDQGSNSTDNSAVQGVSTGPNIITRFINFLTHLGSDK